MIAHLTGTILAHTENSLILDVHGVGYRVLVPNSIASVVRSGEALEMFTHLAVRETALELFGFAKESDVQFFELLIGISGIGPRSALAILNLAPTDTLKTAISRGDTSYLTKVSGIGKKSAEKIVLELKDKIGALPETEHAQYEGDGDVVDALLALGYAQHEARAVLAELPDSTEGTGARLKEALKLLGSH